MTYKEFLDVIDPERKGKFWLNIMGVDDEIDCKINSRSMFGSAFFNRKIKYIAVTEFNCFDVIFDQE